MTEDEAKGFGINDEIRRRYFRAYDDKNNRAPPSQHSDWYHLASVELGNGDDLSSGDSIGVVEPWTPPDAFEGVTSDHLYQVQRVIDGGRWRENIQATEWAGHAVATVMGWQSDSECRVERARIAKILRHWISNGALVVTEAPDAKGTFRKWVEVGTWAIDSPPVTSR